jgi:hypothetical protein
MVASLREYVSGYRHSPGPADEDLARGQAANRLVVTGAEGLLGSGDLRPA